MSVPVIDVNASNIYKEIAAGRKITDRATYKRIKTFDHAQMDRFLTDVCLNGYRDGVADAEKALAEHYAHKKTEDDTEEVQMDFSEVLAVIGQVRGIGEKRLAEIEKRCMEAFG